MRFSRARLAALAAVTVSLACGKDSGVAGVLVVSVVEVTPGITGVTLGLSIPLVASPKTSSGVPVPGRAVTWTSLNTSLATVSSTGVVTGNAVGGPVTIRAMVDGVTGDALVTVNAVPVSRVTVTPPSTPVPTGQSVQLTATAFDAGGATLSGRSFLWESGDPNIAAVTTDGRVLGVSPGGPVNITATSEGKSGSSAVTVTPRLADRLGFAQQPTTTPAGAPFSPTVKVAIQDVLLGTVTGATDPVTIALAANPSGATLSGTTTVSAINGIATFGDLTLNRVGAGYTFLAQSGSLISIISNSFSIVAGTAGRLSLATPPPATARSGVSLTTQPVVQLVDASGNNVSQAGLVVTATLVTGAGTLGGTATATTNGSGAATFTNLAITGPVGNYSLGFNAAGVTGVNSGPINLTAGVAAALAITTQPSSTAQNGFPLGQQPRIQILDGAGNPVAQSGTTVTAILETGIGTLGGATSAVTNSNGLATFTSLAINGGAGAYTLRFSAPGLTSVISDPITLGAGVANRIAVTVQPSATAQVAVPLAQQPVVELRDGSNNPVNTAGVTITVTASAGGTVGGTASAITNASGVATFSGISLSGLVGSYTLTFSASGLTSAISNSIALSAGVAAKLGVTTQPSTTALSGVVFAQQPTVQVQDAGGNPVSLGVTVAATIASGPAGGVLGGTLSQATNGSGAAAFTSLKITGPSGAYTIQFSATGLTPGVSNAVTLGSGTATTIAATSVVTQSAVVGTAVATPPSVKVTDASLNPVAGVSVTFAVTAGGGVVLPATPVLTNASGIATATSWTVGTTAGTSNNTVTATSTGLTGSPVTFTATATADVASHVAANSVTSQSAQISTAVSAPPQVKVTDQFGNPVSGFAVSFAVTAGGGTVVPAAPTTVLTNGSGIAATTSWTLGPSVGTNTVRATAGTLGGSPIDFNATGIAGSPTNIGANSATTQSQVAGNAVTTPPSVKVIDGSSNPVQSVVVTFAVTAGGGSISGPASIATDINGIATVGGWTLGPIAGSNTLTASSGTLIGSPVIFNATGTVGPASQLTITQQPVGGTSGAALTTQPIVAVQDAHGNTVTTDNSTQVSVGVSGAGGTLGGTQTKTVVAGVATFTNLTLTGTVGTNYVLQFTSSPVLTPVSSNNVTVAAAPATKLGITTQPAGGASGDPLGTQPVVVIRDAASNTVTTDNSTQVTVSIASGPVGTLGGTQTVTAVSGIVTFTDLTLTGTAGVYTLQFTSNPSLTPVTSNNVTVTAGAATQLGITTQPVGGASGATLATQPIIAVRDAQNNTVTTDNTTQVTVGVSGAGGTLGGTQTVTVAAGVATFANLTLTGTVGTNYVLQFTSSPVLTPVSSNNVTVTVGAPATLSYNTQPSSPAQSGAAFSPQQPVLLVEDAGGNLVSGVVVTATVTGSPGGVSLVGTTTATTDGAGLATFTDLGLSGPVGTYTLTFTAGALSSGASDPITLGAGAAAKLSITTQPSSTATNDLLFPQQPAIQIVDGAGNPVSASGIVITASIASGGPAIGGNLTATTGVTGLATFANLKITGLVGVRTLSFTATGLTAIVSNNVNIVPGAAFQLAYGSQPSNTAQDGVPFAQQPLLVLGDVSGNPIPGVNVTATITPAGASLIGTDTRTTDALGQASFSGLGLTGTPGDYTLTFTAASVSVTSAPSNTITLTGVADHLSITQQPSATAVDNTQFAVQPILQLRDASNTAVGPAGITVAAALIPDALCTGVGATLTGAKTATTISSGAATFVSLKINVSVGATCQLRFEAPSAPSAVTGVTSNSIVIP